MLSLRETLVDYGTALRMLIQHPMQFFETTRPLPSYTRQALFPLPSVLLYAICEGFIRNAFWWAPIYMIGVYLALAAWTAIIRKILPVFGETRSWSEVLHITAASWMATAFAGIPVVGQAIAVVVAGMLTYIGLVHQFKMNRGAATAAVTLPVVICGLLGSILSFILVGMASISTLWS
jgi:hypothetical protein